MFWAPLSRWVATPGEPPVLLMENRSYETVGAAALASARGTSTALAQAAGFEGGGATCKGKVRAHQRTLEVFRKSPAAAAHRGGPHFAVLPVTNKDPPPPRQSHGSCGRDPKAKKGFGVRITRQRSITKLFDFQW